MKTIDLTQGRFALVDDADFEWLSQWKWYAMKAKRKRVEEVWYAVRHPVSARSVIYMHREIALRLGEPRDKHIDHANRNGLDNRRENLRVCTQSQNNANRGKESGRSSRFKGVNWDKQMAKWRAGITYNGKGYSLGYYETEVEAAMAYANAATQHFGDFAHTPGISASVL